MSPIYLALFSNFFFSLGSQFFAHYSKKFSSLWMNCFKAIIALIGFTILILATSEFQTLRFKSFSFFFISGFIGLGVGDIFLFKAFERIGPARTLMLFGFHPVIVGLLSLILFDQHIPSHKVFSILFFILCIFILSFEGFKKDGEWQIKGLLFAIIGMILDASGVIFTRQAFEWEPHLSAIEGNFHRCIGAIIAYFLISFFKPINLYKNFSTLKLNSRFWVVFASVIGTFISLAMYLEAIQKAQFLASITAISITSVIFSSAFEYIWKKEIPGKYFWFSLVSFLMGMILVLDLFNLALSN